MDRQPVVAGQFYPGSGPALRAQVKDYLRGEPAGEKTLLAMVPHAGYVFSGGVAGKTIASSNLAGKIILLGPNHTGRGEELAVWADGKWIAPGFEVRVDEELAGALLRIPGFSADYQAHMHEHSLEVVIPFLSAVLGDFSMAPVAVSQPDLNSLIEAGTALGRVLKSMDSEVSLTVSTDMSHFLSQDQTRIKDRMAIDQILALDPKALYQVVTDNRISMCGMLPMVLGLACVLEMGAKKADLVEYATSGDINNDYSRVVGYAGILIS